MLGDAAEPVSQPVLFLFQVVLALKAHPELCRVAEKAGEQQRSLRRNGPLPVNDCVNPSSIDSNALRQPILRHAHGNKKFLLENFTGMNGRQLHNTARYCSGHFF